jgi:mono/diheme cytochrome c family protein
MRYLLAIAFLAGWSPLAFSEEVPAEIQFNRDVRPILSDNCFSCHGPDAGHRQADLRLDVREDAIAGGAIEPGQPDASELVARLISTDPETQMPPPSSNKRLTERQIEILRKWIEQDAPYQKHWSYEPPVKAEIPAGENAVDHLVRRKLASVGLQPSPQADRRTLIRRLYNDLLGLPPTAEDVDAFVADQSPDAYGKLVERLLQSPNYGERMAIQWLDVVRFADTIGYHSDNPRNVWPYRDWVIQSFNANKPFDRFTIEQVAGDLLPDANVETRVGSAFNRLLLSTEEGGAQPKDYEARMLTDRVRAIGAAWLGQTTGCAQCHDHKFDPFATRDFYSLGAFFADIQEPILGRREEGMAVTTPEQDAELARLDAELTAARQRHEAILPSLDIAQQQWEADIVAYQVTLPELREGSGASDADKKMATDVAAFVAKEDAQRTPQEREAIRNYFRNRTTKLFAAERQGLAQAEQQRNQYHADLPKCIVSVSTPNKRTVRILPRGDWMNETGEIVKPALPHYLPGPTFTDREPNRLDLATWLVSRDNPLTARTVMNRLWKQFFGTGLSKVLDDLGAQGEPPVNPELLDWLACEFMDSGWDMKQMIRNIVSSETYQQVSSATPELLAADPYNRLLARQSAFRVEAELVRDHALAVAGLLVNKIGGPSVKPYQPEGYWENLNFPVRQYQNDGNENQYRRGLYTWWQRSFLHPSLLAFDAPSREECTAERNLSNIPQQALVLLNDPTYVEAARAFAGRILQSADSTTDSQRIVWAWRNALQRAPSEQEVQLAEQLLEEHRGYYRQDPAAANQLLGVGLAPNPESLDKVELAAWTHIARVLLNLHESITRS